MRAHSHQAKLSHVRVSSYWPTPTIVSNSLRGVVWKRSHSWFQGPSTLSESEHFYLSLPPKSVNITLHSNMPSESEVVFAFASSQCNWTLMHWYCKRIVFQSVSVSVNESSMQRLVLSFGEWVTLPATLYSINFQFPSQMGEEWRHSYNPSLMSTAGVRLHSQWKQMHSRTNLSSTITVLNGHLFQMKRL